MATLPNPARGCATATEAPVLFLLGALVVFRSVRTFPGAGHRPDVLAGFFRTTRADARISTCLGGARGASRSSSWAHAVHLRVDIMQLMTAVSPSSTRCGRKAIGSAQDHAVQRARHGVPGALPVDRISIMLESQPTGARSG